jgi:vacuolar-type H+-ATPase subunit H
MVKEVIGSILEAEEKAGNIVKEANARAHENVQKAEEQAEKIRHDIKEEMRLKASKEYALSESEGVSRAEKILVEGNNAALNIKKAAAKNLEKAAAFIVRRITGE